MIGLVGRQVEIMHICHPPDLRARTLVYRCIISFDLLFNFLLLDIALL